MKIPLTFGLVVVATILMAALDLAAGRPGPPQRHPPGRRQAIVHSMPIGPFHRAEEPRAGGEVSIRQWSDPEASESVHR